MKSAVPELLVDSEPAADAYRALIPMMEEFGDVKVQEKRTTLHLVSGAAAFLGIQPRRDGLRLTVVLDRKLEGPRIVKSEQVSKARYHNEVNLLAEKGLDQELRAWIVEAYKLQHA